MPYLLHIDSSAVGPGSISRQIAGSLRASWHGPVAYRDLAAVPVPHITAAAIAARFTAPTDRDPRQAAATAVQDELIGKFLGAGAHLFTVPMYNFSMPSVFKAWLDQVMVVGATIVPSPAAGRPAFVVSPRDGGYGPGAPNHGMDHLVPHWKPPSAIRRPDSASTSVSSLSTSLTPAGLPSSPDSCRYTRHH